MRFLNLVQIPRHLKIYERNKQISFPFNVLTLTPTPHQHRPCLFQSVDGPCEKTLCPIKKKALLPTGTYTSSGESVTHTHLS